MLTLSIDTATRSQALALVDGPTLKGRFITISKTNHADSLLAHIDVVLKANGIGIGDLDLISVGIGPGSFTGVRVGIATAKALAFSHDIPIVGISTLAGIARPLTGLTEGVIIAAVDARRGEVFHAGFSGSSFAPQWEPKADAYDDFCELLKTQNGFGIGNAFRVAKIQSRTEEFGVRVFPQPWDGPSAPSIAWLGQAKFEKEGAADLTELEPNYIRLSDAEIAAAKRIP